MADTSKHVTYEDAGVDTAEGARAVDAIKQMVAETNRPEVVGGIGGFGGLFSAAALKDMEDPILISGTDGVGTKLVLAQLLDRHETVGQDLVAMCVNDILASGAEPLFFLDYVAIGHIEASQMAKIVKLVEVIPTHTASLNEDYLRLEEMALQDKQERVFKEWLSKKIDGMYVYIDPEFRDGEFANKHWVK